MNPFEKRATEYVRDDLAFLPYVTPEPLLTFLEQYHKEDRLYDRLAVIIGSPGSGKTTLARLFLFPTVTTLLKSRSLSGYASLSDALTKCGALVEGDKPAVAGCRIPLESDYRDCWELPYEEDQRHALLFSLLQARTVLTWVRGFEQSGIPLDRVRLVPRADSAAALEAIGGEDLSRIKEVARRVERDVYNVTAGLVAPASIELPPGATLPYKPFDVIEAFDITDGHTTTKVRPLVIFDDAHVLHPAQLGAMVRWLTRREIRVARWILTRLDALTPQQVFRPDQGPGLNASREITQVWMQSSLDRGASRRAFRKIAKDMADRYLQQMPVFARRRLTSLEELLECPPPVLAPGKLRSLEESLFAGNRRRIGPNRSKEISELVERYLQNEAARSGTAVAPEVRVVMTRILLERYLKRVPQSSLFPEITEATPSQPLKADAETYRGAELQLLHEEDRPFFYGFEKLCDAASENAEKFLRLAGQLVSQLETQLIRETGQRLTAADQNKLLRVRADRMLQDEDLPERTQVMRLADEVGEQCKAKTLEPNAPLGDGANAWGIRQKEFDMIPAKHPELARVLQYGVAYNIFNLVRDYGTKGEIWCLIELSGVMSLHYGLTLGRGGFLERDVSDLTKAIAEEGP